MTIRGLAADEASGPDPDAQPPMSTIVIGGDHVGAALANRLRKAGPVAFLDDCPQSVDRTRESDVDGHVVDPTSRRDLETSVDEPTTAIVSTGEDSVNFLVAQHLRTAFDIDRIVVRVNDPYNQDASARPTSTAPPTW